MGVISMRGANFLKVFTMLLVIGSLLYMYAYSAGPDAIIADTSNWFSTIDKALIFYVGLGVFALFNIMMYTAIYMYRNQIDRLNDYLFKNKKSKERILLWMNYLVSGINLCLVSIVLYIAFAKINELSDATALRYLPIAGLLFLIVSATGLVVAVVKK
ncbi:MAG: hypothetical protein HC819_09985 [Cyclobacteriaceae bacterium]|nr:hypothetical protein [Cyclobacteriaceae bacterium]